MADFVLRVLRAEKFKTIDLTACDSDDRLSWKAVGIHTYLVSRPDGWEFNRRDLVNRHADGKAAVSSGLAELRDAGYLRMIRTKNDDGSFAGWDWYVSERTLLPEEWEKVVARGGFRPKADYPTSENPTPGNRPCSSEKMKQSGDETDSVPFELELEETNGRGASLPAPSALRRNGKGYVYPDDFEKAWGAYPSRRGNNPKKGAYRAWRDRVKGGADPIELLEATEAYARFVEAEGIVGRREVMMARTFFGPDEPWAQDWGSEADSIESEAEPEVGSVEWAKREKARIERESQS